MVIGSDTRLGVQFQTIVTNKEKVYRIDDRVYIALAGLASDATTIVDTIRFRSDLYALKEARPVRPAVLTQMLSNYLYEKRFGPFFSEPIVAGLEPGTNEPQLYSMDLIGCITRPQDFVCSGVEADTLMGMCESVWEPNMVSGSDGFRGGGMVPAQYLGGRRGRFRPST